ncbi:ABC transporter ATP-binding protein [Nitratireductor sp. XY-223]|uniref:ABC transporter ATP-binding protein n=1 Tax=Nitratireductor sp. XY-223 TaxID=2561926 RepID=UPI0010A9E4EA|nr:ABC transporter ATP-binding protein [Nitratireductor sp. XY-223]
MNASEKAGSIRFENVIKNYGQVTAVKDLSLDLEPGKLITLLGPSGCGKTTTLRLIAGLEMASAGSIFVGGKDVTNLTATYRNVSMVFQSYALFPHMSVFENVSYGLKVSAVPSAETRERAQDALAMVGLAGFGERLPSELSGGQQQRVAVARAIVLEPEVLLLDEPLSNLDAKLRRSVREDIRAIQQKLGITVVYVTHDQEEAMAVSDQIIVMRNAGIEQIGSPRDLYLQPVSAFIADFIGDANVVDCDISDVKDGIAEIQFGSASYRIAIEGEIPTQSRLVIRPETIRLSSYSESCRISGEVGYAAYLGNQVQYTIHTELTDLFVIDNRMDGYFPIGSRVSLDLDDSRLCLVEV